MRRILATLMIALGLAGAALPVSATAYSFFGHVCKETPSATVCQEQRKAATKQDNAIYGKNGIIIKVVDILLFVIGAAAVIIIVISGIRYMTSNGDSNGISGAKSAIIYALVGLIVAVAARSIIAFVINRVL